MANDFKRFQVSITQPQARVLQVTLYTQFQQVAGSSALEAIVIGITLANKSDTGITGDIYFDGYGGTDTYIVKGASIPAGSSLEVMSGNKIVVMNNGSTGDVIRVSSGTATALDATISVLEDV
jgi:hypothetical protein